MHDYNKGLAYKTCDDNKGCVHVFVTFIGLQFPIAIYNFFERCGKRILGAHTETNFFSFFFESLFVVWVLGVDRKVSLSNGRPSGRG